MVEQLLIIFFFLQMFIYFSKNHADELYYKKNSSSVCIFKYLDISWLSEPVIVFIIQVKL